MCPRAHRLWGYYHSEANQRNSDNMTTSLWLFCPGDTEQSVVPGRVYVFPTLILYWQDVKFSYDHDVKFSNTNAVLTSDVVFACSSQSREVISGVSEARMQWVFKGDYLCGLDAWQQPTHLFSVPFPLSFHPLPGGFQSEAREPSGGTLRRLQGVQSKKTLTDCLTVMFYGWLGGGGAHSLIKHGGQWSTRVSQKKSYRSAVAQKKTYLPTLAVNSFIRFYWSFASLLQEQHCVMCLMSSKKDTNSLSPSIFCQYLPRDLATPRSGGILSRTLPSFCCIWRCVNVVPQWIRLCLYIKKNAGCKFQILSLWYPLWFFLSACPASIFTSSVSLYEEQANSDLCVWSGQGLMTLPASFCMCPNSQERENGDLIDRLSPCFMLESPVN